MARARSVRPGFTLIELLVVLVVVAILVGLSIGTVLEHLRRSAVSRAATDVVGAANEARRLALLDRSSGRVVYGVRILDDPGEGPASVAVVERVGGEDRVLLTPGGEPLFARTLPSSLVLMLGDGDLRSTTDKRLSWYYGNGSGQVLALIDGELSSYPVAVGLPAQRITNVWGQTENTGTAPTVAPSTEEHPGLWIRTTDNRFANAISVHHNGVAHIRQIGGTDG